MDRGREGGARHGRLGAGCRARAHRRRAHHDPLRRHLPGPRPGARTLRCLRSTDMRRYGLPIGLRPRTSTHASRTPSPDGVRGSVSGCTARAPATTQSPANSSAGSSGPRPVRAPQPTTSEPWPRSTSATPYPWSDAPTLVLHASRDRVIPIELAHFIAERIPDATLAEVDSADHLIWFSDAVDSVADQIQDFLVGAVPNRRSAGCSPPSCSSSGCVPVHQSLAGAGRVAESRTVIGRFRGRIVRHDSGGILATFDGPARAIRCTSELVAHLWPSELSVRVGVHSGECDATSTGISGVAVDIARGVADIARPGEVLVSQTVRDLVLGSTITFRDPCAHQLQTSREMAAVRRDSNLSRSQRVPRGRRGEASVRGT